MIYPDAKAMQPSCESTIETQSARVIADPVNSVIPGITRLFEDLRSGYRSGSRIAVQFDWIKGRMALTY
jgi:hypothetical protein